MGVSLLLLLPLHSRQALKEEHITIPLRRLGWYLRPPFPSPIQDPDDSGGVEDCSSQSGGKRVEWDEVLGLESGGSGKAADGGECAE